MALSSALTGDSVRRASDHVAKVLLIEFAAQGLAQVLAVLDVPAGRGVVGGVGAVAADEGDVAATEDQRSGVVFHVLETRTCRPRRGRPRRAGANAGRGSSGRARNRLPLR
jgi:hypothetical protein